MKKFGILALLCMFTVGFVGCEKKPVATDPATTDTHTEEAPAADAPAADAPATTEGGNP